MGHTLSFKLLFGNRRGAIEVLGELSSVCMAFAEYLDAMELNIYCSQILDLTAFDCIVRSPGVIFHWRISQRSLIPKKTYQL